MLQFEESLFQLCTNFFSPQKGFVDAKKKLLKNFFLQETYFTKQTSFTIKVKFFIKRISPPKNFFLKLFSLNNFFHLIKIIQLKKFILKWLKTQNVTTQKIKLLKLKNSKYLESKTHIVRKFKLKFVQLKNLNCDEPKL